MLKKFQKRCTKLAELCDEYEKYVFYDSRSLSFWSDRELFNNLLETTI